METMQDYNKQTKKFDEIEKLASLKKKVRGSHDYFKDNYKRFNDFIKFVFESSLTDNDRLVLQTLDKAELEFNTGEAFISRLCGEFAKQEPSVLVTNDEIVSNNEEQIAVVQGHFRHIFFESSKNGLNYSCYQDITCGGFSAAKVITEYANPKSFHQVLKVVKCFHPTLCGWDPLAQLQHKGDGNYCFELFPLTVDEAKEKFPQINFSESCFVRQVEGFNWCYNNNRENIVLICDFYEKQKKRVKLLELSTGHVTTKKEYEHFLKNLDKMGYFQPPPGIKRERITELEVIIRYRFFDKQIIEEEVTDYPELPIVFIDGNSRIIKNGTSGNFHQMTRPYLYNYIGTQKLKNFAGQSLANELENLVQHKFKVAKESLPDEKDYLDAYSNIQKASTLVYNHLYNNDPNVLLPAPQEIVRPPIPPELTNTFQMCDSLTQTILGSFDASLGINDNQLSGVAIIEGATQSNSAAMPYVVSFMHSFTQIANIIVKMMPKYYVEPRKIATMQEDGTTGYANVNQEGGVYLNYDENAYKVQVEAGPNFAIQRNRTLNQLISLSKSSQIFSQFLNTKGLKVLVDNLEIKGQDQLKKLAEEFMMEEKQKEQIQQQMAEQQMKNNPLMISAQTDRMRAEEEAKKNEINAELKAAEIEIKQQNSDVAMSKVFADIKNSEVEAAVKIDKVDAEKSRAAVDLAVAQLEHVHKQGKEMTELHHKIRMDEHKIKQSQGGDANYERQEMDRKSDQE